MDEFELRKKLGKRLFAEGREIVDGHRVEGPMRYDDSLCQYDVRELDGTCSKVIVRTYEGDRDDLYDCDCSARLCRHVSAVMISRITGDDDDVDESAISELEGRIDSLYEDITSDPDYDEEENYWEDWEIRKYGLEQHNDVVEHDHVEEILEDIFCTVKDPVVTIDLLDRLFRSIKGMEIDNGGTDDAIGEFRKEIEAAASYADETTVSRIVSSNPYGEPWIFEYIGKDLGKIKEAAYRINVSNGDCNGTVRRMMLERGDYDELIACRGENVEDIVDVAKRLVSAGDIERAKLYAGKLVGKDPEHHSEDVADLLFRTGFVDEASDIYLRLYERRKTTWRLCGGLEFLDRAFMSERVQREKYLDEIVSMECNGKDFDLGAMSFLIKYGREKDAEKTIRQTGYRYRIFFRDPDFQGIRILCQGLKNHDLYETSASLARSVIEQVLKANDNKNYSNIVPLIRMMDEDDGFESISVPHSKYMEDLRVWAAKKSKFWGIYNGTYVEKRRERYWWRIMHAGSLIILSM
ncbi:MAG: hypothetical protein J5674_02990 [Candidatus Methanomethylophilaceae archaeon]|nr:hypothetical protein [Candidatus Methanomethylophilaceae archaeon]